MGERKTVFARPYEGPADVRRIANLIDDSRQAAGRDAPPIGEEDVVAFIEKSGANWDPFRDVHLYFQDDEMIGFGRTKREQWADGTCACYLEPSMHFRWKNVQTLSDVIELMCGHQIEMASEEGCGGRAFLAAIPDPGDEPFKNALLASGFRQGHVFLKMERPLESVDVSGDLPEGLTVRVPNVEDYRDVYEFDRKIMRGQWAVETPTDEHFRWWSEEAFLNPELWLVGWDGDRIVATTAGAVGGTWNPALGGDRAEIRFVRVDPAWRRRGIASNLIQRCLKALYDRGIRQVELSVDGENETSAAALYRSLGFEVTSSLHAYCRDFGE